MIASCLHRKVGVACRSVYRNQPFKRRFAKQPRYVPLRRALKNGSKRNLYVTRPPHDIWHLDAKDPVKSRVLHSRAPKNDLTTRSVVSKSVFQSSTKVTFSASSARAREIDCG